MNIAASWKAKVLAIHPAAICNNEGEGSPPNKLRRFIVRTKVGGDEIGASYHSSSDAWRVAFLNETSGKPAAMPKTLDSLWGGS